MSETEKFSPLAIARKHFSAEAMKQSPSREELYSAIDALGDAHQKLKARVEALETHGIKYAGVWQKALAYRKGLVTTFDGAMWIALRDTAEGEQPGKALDAWQMAAKAENKGTRR